MYVPRGLGPNFIIHVIIQLTISLGVGGEFKRTYRKILIITWAGPIRADNCTTPLFS